MLHRHRHRRVALVGAVALALAACGGEATPVADDTGVSTAAPSASTSPDATEEPPTGPDTDPTEGTEPTGSPVAAVEDDCPMTLPAERGFDAFYGQWCDVLGIPLVAHADVAAEAMREGAAIIALMLDHRPDIAAALASSDVRIGIIGRQQRTTEMPEWSDLYDVFPDVDWDERARGLGATIERPLVAAGEENLLCLAEDRYLGESIFVHELAHTIHEFGAQVVDPTFDERLTAVYDDAAATGRWADTYAMSNPYELWAEAVQSFFDTNLADDFQHNHVDTRPELAAYDPDLYALVVEVFGEPDWRWSCP